MSKARDLSDFISTATVDATEIADGAVTTAKVSDANITHAKLHTDMNLSGKTITLADDQISGNKIHGGTISNFASTGIDDNASSTSVTIDSSGRVGIGTATIGDKLVVQGAASATASIVIQDPTANDYGTHLSFDDANSKAIFGGLTNGTKNPALRVARDATSGIDIDSFGNVGIGTTSPDALLQLQKTRGTISGGSSDTGAVIKLHTEAQWESGYGNNPSASTNDYLGSIEFSSGDSSNGEGVRAAIRGTVDSYYNQNSIVFETATGATAEAPQERMRVLHNGNVGIGTANPNGKLTIALENSNTPAFRLSSPTSGTDFAISSYNDANGTYVSMGVNHLFDVSGNDAVMDTNDKSAAIVLDGRNNGRIQFLTNSSGIATPRMTISQAGNVGIGNTDADRPLTITANSGANALALRARSNDDYAFIQFWNNAGNTLRGQIYNHNGNIGFTTGNDSSAGDDLYISDNNGVGINTSTTGGPSGRLTVYQDDHDAYTPTSFLDKPTMQLRHANNVNGYTGIRYSNNNGTYEWFTGAHQKTADAADFVTQGHDRQLNVYRENQRIYDTGQIVQPRQPSFMAHKSSHLSISSSGSVEAGGWSTTHVVGGHNTGGHFNTSTGRFTVPVAGRYKFDANIMHGITSGDFQIWIVVNGNTANAVRSNSMQSTGGNWKQTTVTALLNLSANDYISIYARSSASETYAMYGSATQAFTTCNGYLLG